MNKYILLLAVAIALLSSTMAMAEDPTIRVRILSKHRPQDLWIVELDNFSKTHIEIDAGKILINGKKRKFFTIGTPEDRTIRAISLRDIKKLYKGKLEMSSNGKELVVINELNVSDYLIGVLPAEIGKAPLEALKAQAVLARTLAYEKIVNRNSQTSHDSYDLVDLTINQAYSGYNEVPIYRKAIEATNGLIIVHKGKPIIPFYHSTCGDVFYTPEDLWNGPRLAYLRTDRLLSRNGNHLCKNYPHYSWKREIDAKKLRNIIQKKTRRLLSKDYPRRRKKQIALDDAGNTLPLEHFRLAINRVMGWNVIKSNDYHLIQKDNQYHFSGFGLGHNMGVCQCETIELAKKGESFRDILNRYFKEIQIKNRPQRGRY